ncbi:hypothetical protein MMC22_006966 [Lobaria immixta]|nr:hypothetical protein [Lobaria immixta]
MPGELSVGIGGDQAERRGFHFFQTYVWPQLTRELHSVFWERLILQASHADAVMRHAAIAFGSLGERLLINDVMTFDNEDANKLHNFACSQYYKAIKLLRQQLSSGEERSIEFTLTACFIFICFEFLQGNESAVLTHLKSGIDIIRRSDLQGTRFDPNTTVSLMESVDFGYHVAIIFALLDREAANWMAAPPFGMPTPVIPYSDYRSLVSEGFPNIDDADEYLSDIYARLYPILPSRAFLSSDSDTLSKPLPAAIPLLEGALTLLDNWSRSMDVFMSRSRHELSLQDSRRATALILHHRVANLRLTASCQASEENFYRNSEPEFDCIVSMSTALCRPISSATGSRGSEDERHRLLFSFHGSIIYPLYFTATHCQDPKIQEEALSLLSTSPWREGAWDSAAMATIAKRRILERKEYLFCNKKQPTSHVAMGLDMAEFDLQQTPYQVGASSRLFEDRITELSDSDRSF